MCKRVVTQSVQERFLCCTCTLPLVKVVANMRLGRGERSLLLYEFYVDLFLFLLAHEPAALEEHIMELKHLTDCKSYRGLQLLPCATSRCVPDSLVLYPDRDFFPVKYYPDRGLYICFYNFLFFIPTGFYI